MHDDIARRLVVAIQQMADAQTAQAEAYTSAMEMLAGLITPEGIKSLLTTVKSIVEQIDEEEPGVDAARYAPDNEEGRFWEHSEGRESDRDLPEGMVMGVDGQPSGIIMMAMPTPKGEWTIDDMGYTQARSGDQNRVTYQGYLREPVVAARTANEEALEVTLFSVYSEMVDYVLMRAVDGMTVTEARAWAMAEIDLDLLDIPAATVVSVEWVEENHQRHAMAIMSDGSQQDVLAYFTDELSFTEDELVGLTRLECGDLFHRKDVAFIQTP